MWWQVGGRVQMVARGLLLVVATLAGAAFTAGPAYAQSPASGGARHASVTYDVRADIDGHSKLTLWAGSAQWHHFDYAAPGRENGKNDPTIINGVKWFPTWPHAGENRDCDCYSNKFRKVTPRVPKNGIIFSFQEVSCRDSCSATFSKGALVIDFNDDPSLGDAWYEVKITLAWH
jgi:hypothetical protein